MKESLEKEIRSHPSKKVKRDYSESEEKLHNLKQKIVGPAFLGGKTFVTPPPPPPNHGNAYIPPPPPSIPKETPINMP